MFQNKPGGAGSTPPAPVLELIGHHMYARLSELYLRLLSSEYVIIVQLGNPQ